MKYQTAPKGCFFKEEKTMTKFIQYLRDVKGEMNHVTWPSTRTTIQFTVIVIIISLATAYYLGFFDFVFTKLLDTFVV